VHQLTENEDDKSAREWQKVGYLTTTKTGKLAGDARRPLKTNLCPTSTWPPTNSWLLLRHTATG